MEPLSGSSSLTKLAAKAAVESILLKVPMRDDQGVCSFLITASAKSVPEESLVPGSERAAVEITFKVHLKSAISSFGVTVSESVNIVEKQPLVSNNEDKVDSSCFRCLLKVRVGRKAFENSISVDASTIIQKSDDTISADGDHVMGIGMETSFTDVEGIAVARMDETVSSAASHPDDIKVPDNSTSLPDAEKRSSWVGAYMKVGGLFSEKEAWKNHQTQSLT